MRSDEGGVEAFNNVLVTLKNMLNGLVFRREGNVANSTLGLLALVLVSHEEAKVRCSIGKSGKMKIKSLGKGILHYEARNQRLYVLTLSDRSKEMTNDLSIAEVLLCLLL